MSVQVELGNITSLAKTWKKLSAEDLLGGDEAALASAVKVSDVSFDTEASSLTHVRRIVTGTGIRV